ncbi:hypothetical protein GWK08_05300 [Leptobacterium flavescens]|uniref:DUF2268 domain-containing protein n=1 Tax=Leptobacterium flavescens TaxID=472055 RepID=A0A6P0UR02_9FLAO|nr:DUF2268 domain-containing putative Zn-dependent protease [Leptobacterium flavescens]NER12846.1 hypothetical protein [Leptobacterium flavescens]
MKLLKKLTLLVFGLFFTLWVYGQEYTLLDIGRTYKDIPVDENGIRLQFQLKKGGVYHFNIKQDKINKAISIGNGKGEELMKIEGHPRDRGNKQFEFSPGKSGKYSLSIGPFRKSQANAEPRITIRIHKLSNATLRRREEIKKELAPENAKNVQTLDIDHFWEAFDALKDCRSYTDSVATFQKIYIDRATDGFKEFIRVRPSLTAENYIHAVRDFPKFYNSIRPQTYKVKEAAPLVEDVFRKFKEIYPNFKPFKVCFAIGRIRTGGTVSKNFVLIGSEMTTSTAKNDLSEFKEPPFNNLIPFLAYEGDIVQKIKNIVAHECVHSQQQGKPAKDAIQCSLLSGSLLEGSGDFIGELLVGENINKKVHKYGNAHEEELWNDFKKELCTNNFRNWMYNYASVKDKPADLGYYIGYKIAEAYYKNAEDKQKAIIDIIEFNDPIEFLQKSKYDLKFRKKQ